MTFEEYLISKKIDLVKFQQAEPSEVTQWRILFDQVHPGSFTAQKLFLINAKRRNYPISIVKDLPK